MCPGDPCVYHPQLLTKRVLTSAAQRLADKGGDPVIGLQTAFGGGKTHTMLAIFHLAKHLAGGRRSARVARSWKTCHCR